VRTFGRAPLTSRRLKGRLIVAPQSADPDSSPTRRNKRSA
jgi:hypothetical protein